ncbi:hypothetical protein A2U01_0070784, partial [Trifolium medium]|nr:hypothetical protein [Trifolium medium]
MHQASDAKQALLGRQPKDDFLLS